ncbi:unnamed protein product, partial [Musa textilis]
FIAAVSLQQHKYFLTKNIAASTYQLCCGNNYGCSAQRKGREISPFTGPLHAS